MKICVISDIHASSKWKEIVLQEKDSCDRFVFLGDYFDSKGRNLSCETEYENFQEIVAYRAQHPNIDLLIGNHDIQYLGSSYTSGYRRTTYELAHNTLQQLVAQGDLQMAVCYHGYLFSHAGISQEWLRHMNFDSWEEANERFKADPDVLAFVHHPLSNPTGDDPFQGPVWIRPYSLLLAPLPGYHQIVGHTRLQRIRIQQQCGHTYFFTDTTMRQYLVIDTDTHSHQILPVP